MGLHVVPVGPLAAGTYWRRRLLLLAAVLLLLVVGRSCAGDGADVVSGPQATPTASARPTAPVPPRASPSRAPTRTAPVTCPDRALRVVVAAEPRAATAARPPGFRVTVTNTGTVACRRDLGPEVVSVVVTSGRDRIWSSADCEKGTAAEVVPFGPRESTGKLVGWTGTRSKPGCPSGRSSARPGTYVVTASVGALRSEGVVFRLS